MKTQATTRTAGRKWTGKIILPKPITRSEYDAAVADNTASVLLRRFVLELPKPGYLIEREYREIVKSGGAAEYLRRYIKPPKPLSRLKRLLGKRKRVIMVDPDQIDISEIIPEATP